MNQLVAIYGGAFNPPTLGHFHVVEKIFENTNVEKIVIVPDGFRLDKDYGINDIDRINMINIFIGELTQKGFNIELDDYFMKNNQHGDTTTLKVDKYFIEKLGFRPIHVFGTDISSEIKNWTGNPNKYIEKKLKKIFINRPPYVFKKQDFENYELIEPEKNINISSTEVRKNINSKKSIKKLVSMGIEKYIIQNNLYK